MFDEVFSGDDTAFMEKAAARTNPMIDKANMLIMVSRNDVLVRSHCNRVIRIDYGRIKAGGSPEEIVER